MGTKKSICLLTTCYPAWNDKNVESYSCKFVHDMAKFFTRQNMEVHVLTHHIDGLPESTFVDGVQIHRFRYCLPGCRGLSEGGIPENIKRLRGILLLLLYFSSLLLNAFRIVNKYNIDIINAHWTVPTGFLGYIVKVVTRKKLVITAYGAEFFPVTQGRMPYLKPFIKKAITGADVVAGISKATVDAAKSLSGREDIHIIPDGIDTDYYRPVNSTVDILSKYNSGDKRVIFFTGRMVERKGHEFLLQAMREVSSQMPNVKLILGGDGPLYDRIALLRERWKLEEYVELPGYISEEDMIPLLQSADVFVLPSIIDEKGDTEGSATIALEAMACETPAVISKVGGNIGMIEEGKGGFYCEPADVKDLAGKILSLLQNGHVSELGRTGRNYVKERFSWEQVVRTYMVLLDK